MKIKAIISMFVLLFLLVLNTNSEERKSKYDPEKVRQMIKNLGGGFPKAVMKFFDADLLDMNGKRVKLSDYSGKVIMLNLWASWCPPCKHEMPSIQKLYESYKSKNFVWLAVSQGENLDTVKNFVSGVYTFPVFVDINNDVSGNYSTGSIPTTYIIDKDGYILAGFVGGREWNSPEVRELLDELLK